MVGPFPLIITESTGSPPTSPGTTWCSAASQRSPVKFTGDSEEAITAVRADESSVPDSVLIAALRLDVPTSITRNRLCRVVSFFTLIETYQVSFPAVNRRRAARTGRHSLLRPAASATSATD
jgi:hypothetical protein